MRRPAGHSLAELLVACALFSLIVSVAFGALELASRGRAGAESRLDPRKANRALLDRLSTTLRKASFVFTDSPLSFGGHNYNDLPALETPGRSLVAVVPESDDPRIGLFSVVGVYTRPRQPVDPANPYALQVVIHTVNGVLPTSAGLPASIDFSALPPGGMRVFDTYLDALEFNVLSAHRDRISMRVTFERDMPRGPRARETYSTEVFLRNQ
ncbi:MAG: hypothetical protein AMXMBFR33_70940 [Candidatus Xenobia bacterium]